MDEAGGRWDGYHMWTQRDMDHAQSILLHELEAGAANRDRPYIDWEHKAPSGGVLTGSGPSLMDKMWNHLDQLMTDTLGPSWRE